MGILLIVYSNNYVNIDVFICTYKTNNDCTISNVSITIYKNDKHTCIHIYVCLITFTQ